MNEPIQNNIAYQSKWNNNQMGISIGNISLFELCVYGLTLLTAVGGLSIVNNNPAVEIVVNALELGFDLVLVLAVCSVMKSIRSVLLVLIAAVCGVLIAINSGSTLYLKGILILICAINSNPIRYLLMVKNALALSLCIGVVLELLGLGPGGDFRRDGMAFGFVHPNQAALFACVLWLVQLVYRSMLDLKMKLSPSVVVLVIYLILTGSRTAIALVIVAELLYAVCRRAKSKKTPATISRALMLLPIILFVFSLITALLVFQVPILQTLNQLLSTRIWLNWYALTHFDITLFGQEGSFQVSHVYDAFRNHYDVTTTVDCTYIVVLLRYGVLGAVMWLMLYTVAINSALEHKETGLVVVLCITAIYSFSESQMVDPLVNFALITPFAIAGGQYRGSRKTALTNSEGGR